MAEEYQVFISFKSTDKQNQKTWDFEQGEQLYHALEQRGIKTFFSPRSIPDMAASDYQEVIYDALYEADIFVAMCSDPSYLKEEWIKEEILTFRQRVLDSNANDGSETDSKEKLAMYTYRHTAVKENSVPAPMRRCQMYDSLEKIVEVIERRLAKKVNQDVTEIFDAVEVIKQIETPDYKNGEIVMDDYSIVKRIGNGGVGIVYLVKKNDTEKLYAFKRSRAVEAEHQKGFSMSLEIEWNCAKDLDHPYIPHYYEGEWMNEHSFGIIMEYIEGINLLDEVKENGAFPEERVLDIAKQLCEAVAYLHKQKKPIIYRDIKPGNLIMRPDGTLVLIDFSSAKIYDPNDTEPEISIGTKGYAAPEQYGGLGQTDAKTDIFGFGMTLFHLITGVRPLNNINMNTIYDTVKGFSEPLACVIEHCTELDPVDRYESMEEILTVLNDIESITRIPRKVYTKPMNLVPGGENETIVSADEMDISCVLVGADKEIARAPQMVPVAPIRAAVDNEATVQPLSTFSPLGIMSVVAYIAISCANKKKKRYYVHVYLCSDFKAGEVGDILSKHLDYEKVVMTDSFFVYPKAVITVDVTSEHITFDSPKRAVLEASLSYLCFETLEADLSNAVDEIAVKISAKETVFAEEHIKVKSKKKS